MRARPFQSLALAHKVWHDKFCSHFYTEHGLIIGFLGLRQHGNPLECAAEPDHCNNELLCAFKKVSLTQFTHCNK